MEMWSKRILFLSFFFFFFFCLTYVIRASVVAQLIKNLLLCGRTGFDPWVEKTHWSWERLLTLVFWPGEFHGLYSPWGHK